MECTPFSDISFNCVMDESYMDPALEECTHCTVCYDDEKEIVPCTFTTNRVCVPSPVTTPTGVTTIAVSTEIKSKHKYAGMF